MGFSVWQLLIVALVILILFGRGRISEMMGDFGKGIKSFKKGMAEEESSSAGGQIEGPPAGSDAAKDTQSADKSAS